MTRAPGSALLLVCAAISLSLGGCMGVSHSSANPLTAAEAKKQTQAIEREIASAVPKENTARLDQAQRGSFLSCDATTIQWSGLTRVYFEGKPDVDAVLKQLQQDWNHHDGYKVSREKSRDGMPSVAIRGKDFAAFLVGPVKSYQYLEIDSFSSCFTPDAGQKPGDVF